MAEKLNKNEAKALFLTIISGIEADKKRLNKVLSNLEAQKSQVKKQYFEENASFKIGEEAEIITYGFSFEDKDIERFRTKTIIMDYRVFDHGLILPVCYKYTKKGKVSKDRYHICWEHESIVFANGDIIDLRKK